MSQLAIQKKNVLIVISTMGQLPEMLRIANLLTETHNFHPIIYFNLGVPVFHPNISFCINSGFDVLGFLFGYLEGRKKLPQQNAAERTQSTSPGKLRSPKFNIKRIVKEELPFLFEIIKGVVYRFRKSLLLLGFFYRVGIKIKRLRHEERYFKLFNIKLMLFAEDSEDYFTPQLIKIGHKHGVKSVVFPYTFANQYEFLEDAFFNDRRTNKNILSFLAAKWFPKWTCEYKGKKLLKSTPALIFSSELFNTSAPNPWVMSSGYADVIAVESQFMKDYYGKAGIPEGKMIETGYPSLDHLFKIYKGKKSCKDQLATRYGFDAKKPWVVCAVPPSQWPRAGVGYQTYEQFLNEFINFFSSFKNVEILFKFHPRLDPLDIKKICDTYGVRFVQEDTAELIAVSDIFIASASSTIRWALALGIPTINYDMYNYNYGDFDSFEDCHTVVKFDEFKNVFNNLHENLFLTGGRQENNLQSKFGKLDGNAGQRIADLFNSLVAE